MLLPDNILPEHSIFYNGSLVLLELQKETSQSLLELYNNVRIQTPMTFPTFVLCLDWLFLIDAATLGDRGKVELCS